MNCKRGLIILLCIILSQFVIAQDYKIEVSTIPEDKIFGSMETIQIKVSLYDSNNNLINDEVLIHLNDLKGVQIKETAVQSNKFERIELTENVIAGEGEMIISYKGYEKKEYFFIKENEIAKFEISDGVLKITNIGNTKYERKVYITIGETTGAKNPKIDIGKSKTYRLVAPDGIYNVKVSDGISETFEINGMELKSMGIGQVIGALDEEVSNKKSLTGGISPDENADEALLNYVKKSKFPYVFILVICGIATLLAIERRYRRK
ncbi:MAG: hypothetical protein PVJ67_05525 [Candidatus Pacearchaeota archaeon]|jgi:hypothetical protein